MSAMPAVEEDIYRKMGEVNVEDTWRRRCGCLRTSEKLKRILASFPPPPPPSPLPEPVVPSCAMIKKNCISVYCTRDHAKNKEEEPPRAAPVPDIAEVEKEEESKKGACRTWKVLTDLVLLLQLSVTATALAIYYLIYCYMQLIYYALRSAVYFHQADGPMKLTIGVVTLTSVFVLFNLILKLEKLIWISK